MLWRHVCIYFYHRCRPVVTMFTRSENVSVFVWISEWCTAVLCALCPLFLSFPFISFSFLLLFCARRHRIVPVCEGQQKTSPLGAVREGHSYSYWEDVELSSGWWGQGRSYERHFHFSHSGNRGQDSSASVVTRFGIVARTRHCCSLSSVLIGSGELPASYEVSSRG